MSEQADFVPSVPPVGRESGAPDGDGSMLVPADGPTITPLQNTAYIGILASICIFGFAAVIAFQRGVQQSQRLKPVFFGFGIVLVALAIHALISGRLFAAYLNGEIAEASLFYRVAGWVLFAPMLAWLRLSLFGFGRKRGINQIIDSTLFASVFLIAAIGLQSGVEQTISIIFALLAVAIYAVIIARSFGLKQQGLKAMPGFLGGPHKLIWDSLVFGPAIIPLLVVMRSFGFPHDLIHLLLSLGEVAIVISTVAGVALCTTNQFDAMEGGDELDVDVDSTLADDTDFEDPFGDAAIIAESKKSKRPKTVIRMAGSKQQGTTPVPKPSPKPVDDPLPEEMESIPLGQEDMEAPIDTGEEDIDEDISEERLREAESAETSEPESSEEKDAPSSDDDSTTNRPVPKPSVKPPPKPKRRF